jgi:site-specific recombinase XerD
MTTSTTTTTLVVPERLFTAEEELALTGFLGGYNGLTREAYALDLRQYVTWCAEHRVTLFGARRSDIEAFGRHLEDNGRARATIARRLGTIAVFYRYALEEDLIATSPAVHVRRPRLDYESHATGLDRNEVGAMLVAAGLAGGRDHALISLLALNGLRVSEATSANIEALGLERGHRTLTILRKGAKTVLIPLAPRTARAVDLAVGERSEGPIFLGPDGDRLDRHAAARIVRRVARRAGIAKRVDPTPCVTRSSPPPSTQASPSAMSKKPPVTPTRAPQCVTTELECPSTVTPPTSSPPSSPARPANTQARSGTPIGAPERALRAASHGHRRRSISSAEVLICRVR